MGGLQAARTRPARCPAAAHGPAPARAASRCTQAISLSGDAHRQSPWACTAMSPPAVRLGQDPKCPPIERQHCEYTNHCGQAGHSSADGMRRAVGGCQHGADAHATCTCTCTCMEHSGTYRLLADLHEHLGRDVAAAAGQRQQAARARHLRGTKAGQVTRGRRKGEQSGEVGASMFISREGLIAEHIDSSSSPPPPKKQSSHPIPLCL